jgi:hypothetical protein
LLPDCSAFHILKHLPLLRVHRLDLMLMPRMQRLRSVQQMQLGMHWQHVDSKTE